MKKRLLLNIFGRVQGVGFRYQVREYALAHGISGIAENLDNGRVGIIAEGEEEALRGLIQFCYNGIQYAEVKSMDEQWENADGDKKDFHIK